MKKPRKSIYLTASKAKLMEWIGVAVIVVLFIVLAFLNRGSFCTPTQNEERVLPTTSPSGTRISAWESAAKDAGFTVQDDVILLADDEAWAYTIESDTVGITELCITVPLRTISKGDSKTDALFNLQNDQIRESLLSLLEKLWPVFGGSYTDAEKLVQGCENALSTQKTKSFSTKTYSLQTVPVENGILLRIRRLELK